MYRYDHSTVEVHWEQHTNLLLVRCTADQSIRDWDKLFIEVLEVRGGGRHPGISTSRVKQKSCSDDELYLGIVKFHNRHQQKERRQDVNGPQIRYSIHVLSYINYRSNQFALNSLVRRHVHDSDFRRTNTQL